MKPLVLADEEPTGHLPKLIEDLVSRLNRPISVRRRTVTPSIPLPSYTVRCDRGKANSRDAVAPIQNPSGDPVGR